MRIIKWNLGDVCDSESEEDSDDWREMKSLGQGSDLPILS